MTPEFQSFDKIARLNREIIITEKIDGTNAQIFIEDDGTIHAGSRNRWLTPEEDNYGFCKWVMDNQECLAKLGPGRHFGEWWGRGINRGYGKEDRTFSLFNVHRWTKHFWFYELLDAVEAPECCDVVPILYSGDFNFEHVNDSLEHLKQFGSVAAHGFKKPEGIVVYHTAAKTLFKVTIENDEKRKSDI